MNGPGGLAPPSPLQPSADLSEGWAEAGLTPAEVEARRAAAGSADATRSSQGFGAILRRNALTRLNLLLLVLGGATLVTGSAPDATFLIIAVLNTIIGTVQEVRAKRVLDSLAIINAPHATVVRGGRATEVAPEELVVDDLLELAPGDQVTADAVVTGGAAEIDESLATGEADPVPKRAGDELVSGSWLVAGSVRARVLRAGPDSYANRMAEEARRFSLADSELVNGINRVLRILSWIMVCVAPLLILRQLQAQPWRGAIRGTVAGLVGMIPEGLVLLTTLAFLAAALRLAQRKVLVQELPAVETLARVDALCVDKTGTLTEGRVTCTGVHVGPDDARDAGDAVAALAAMPDANATMRAAGQAVTAHAELVPTSYVPFSSARKWSGATFEHHGTWVVGAPEFVAADDPGGLRKAIDAAAASGLRVVVIARSDQPLGGEALPPGLVLVGYAELTERIRPSVSGTLGYFADQGVTVRVISGDSATTVGHVAERVGLPDAGRVVDASGLRAAPGHFDDAIEGGRVFGRVTPQDKRDMVTALRRRGHTVAMTGDGVNDVLALKEADLGIAMGSGSAITRGVAQLVDLGDDFDVLPSVVAEGRRVLTNVERVAALFLVKNVYSLALVLTTTVLGWPYPFLPRHLTLISAVGIGIPGLFLALAPSEKRFTPGFLRRVLAFSVVAGSLTAAAVMVTYALARQQGSSGDSARTAAIVTTVVVTLWVLLMAARPLAGWHLLLVLAMAGLFVGAYLVPGVNTLFSLQHRPSVRVLVQALAIGAVAAAIIDAVMRVPLLRRMTKGGPAAGR